MENTVVYNRADEGNATLTGQQVRPRAEHHARHAQRVAVEIPVHDGKHRPACSQSFDHRDADDSGAGEQEWKRDDSRADDPQ